MSVASVPPTVNRNMSSNMNRMAVIAELFSFNQQVNIFVFSDQTNLPFCIIKFQDSANNSTSLCIRQKLATSGIIHVVVVVLLLTVNLKYYNLTFIFKNSPNIRYSTRYSTRGRVTRPRSINFTIRLWLYLGLRLLLFASTTNLESGPRFADICLP